MENSSKINIPININFPGDIVGKVDEIVKSRRLTRAEVIRQMVYWYLENNKERVIKL